MNVKSMKRWHIWLLAARPKTLSASIVPVWLGGALSWRQESAQPLWLLPILAAAVLIQIGTNLANDYFDFRKGADTASRTGPLRVTQAGLLPPTTVRNGFIICFAAALLIGIPLALRGGWSIVAIGVFSIILGILYTAGPFPIAYRGWSEIFVILFFGIIAVTGTSYLVTGKWRWETLDPGIVSGLLATALLIVNNLRDLPNDRAAGKMTLPVRYGARFGKFEYTACIVGAFAAAALHLLSRHPRFASLCLLAAVPFAVIPIRIVLYHGDAENLIRALPKTALLQIVFGLSYGLALLQ